MYYVETPAMSSIIDVMKTTVWGESRFPARFLGHNCHLYRWTELKEVLSRHPCRIVAATAANFLSVGNGDVLEQVKEDAKVWAAFLHWEEEFCAVPAALDGGNHIIVVAQRT